MKRPTVFNALLRYCYLGIATYGMWKGREDVILYCLFMLLLIVTWGDESPDLPQRGIDIEPSCSYSVEDIHVLRGRR